MSYRITVQEISLTLNTVEYLGTYERYIELLQLYKNSSHKDQICLLYDIRHMT